jgi:hypothetical protein
MAFLFISELWEAALHFVDGVIWGKSSEEGILLFWGEKKTILVYLVVITHGG